MTSGASHRRDLTHDLHQQPRARARLTLAPSPGWARPLLVRVRAGDRDALDELYEALGQAVYDRVHLITRESLAAELITAGVFVRLWRCPHEFRAADLLLSLTRLADRRATRWLGE